MDNFDYTGGIGVIISMIFSLGGALLASFSRRMINKLDNKEVKKSDSRIRILKEMSDNLKDTIKYIEELNDRINNEQKELEKLINERESVELMLNTNKESVDAIFKEQETRQKAKIWIDRAIGFFIGIFSSSIVTAIFYYIIEK